MIHCRQFYLLFNAIVFVGCWLKVSLQIVHIFDEEMHIYKSAMRENFSKFILIF